MSKIVNSILGPVEAPDPAPIQHSPTCLRAHAETAAYDARWPKAHKPCNGTGLGWVPGDWVPYGSGNTQLPGGEEPCSCAEEGKCPRCSNPIVWHDEPDESHLAAGWKYGYFDPCPACGIVSGEVKPEDARPEFECDCWEAAAFESERKAGLR